MGVLRVVRIIAIAIGRIILFIISLLLTALLTFLVLSSAVLIIGQIVTFNEQVEAAYDKGYYTGFDEGYQRGLETAYKQGLATDVDLRNPTYKELLDFLRRDKTDLKPAIEDEYDCEDFSAEVNNNAELEGIRAAYVVISFPQPPGHAIVAFETVDKGLIFIEPQSDERVKLVIGERFYQCIVPHPTLPVHWTRPHEALLAYYLLFLEALEALFGYLYPSPPYDDTIVEIQIIW